MNSGEGRATIFLTPNARIIDRVVAYHHNDSVYLITEPGRSEALQKYLQSNIFYNDKVSLKNITSETHQFALHGTKVGRSSQRIS